MYIYVASVNYHHLINYQVGQSFSIYIYRKPILLLQFNLEETVSFYFVPREIMLICNEICMLYDLFILCGWGINYALVVSCYW